MKHAARVLFLTSLILANSFCSRPPGWCDNTGDYPCPEGTYCDIDIHRCKPQVCNNGIREGTEECDGSSLAGNTCETVTDHIHGTLGCNEDCTFDTSGCHTCGNNQIEGAEVCDGPELGVSTCQTQGYRGGTLACKDDCLSFDLTGCTPTECNNGYLEPGEQCDGDDLGGQTCATVAAKPHGEVVCTSLCLVDASGCHHCGDGVIDGPEECDGADLGGQSCVSTGHSGGILSCAEDCSFDTSLCYACGDGACDLVNGENTSNCIQDCGWGLLSIGRYHNCGLRKDNTAHCWGGNEDGRLGDGLSHQTCVNDYDCSPLPVGVLGLTDLHAISAGSFHSCAVLTTGDAWCWGSNGFGKLGDGTTIDRITPVQVIDIPLAEKVAAGREHTCVATQTGEVWCFGHNGYGQLGNGDTAEKPGPVPVSGLLDVVSISTQDYHTCAVDADGDVWCWGLNSFNVLGNDSSDQTCQDGLYCSPTPVMVSSPNIYSISNVSVGQQHTCAARTDGTAWCWGRNRYGQLGINSTENSTIPIQVYNINNVDSVGAGFNHTCALKSDGTVWCWGRNNAGQIGDGTFSHGLAPIQVPGLHDVVFVRGGFYHSCALHSNMTIHCWGSNEQGQLGDGTLNTSAYPVAVMDF